MIERGNGSFEEEWGVLIFSQDTTRVDKDNIKYYIYYKYI